MGKLILNFTLFANVALAQPCVHTQAITLPFGPTDSSAELECVRDGYRQQEALLLVQKRALREHIRNRKKDEAEQQRRLRLQNKCELVRQKIEILNKRYKQEYTIATSKILDKKLADLNIKKLKFCD